MERVRQLRLAYVDGGTEMETKLLLRGLASIEHVQFAYVSRDFTSNLTELPNPHLLITLKCEELSLADVAKLGTSLSNLQVFKFSARMKIFPKSSSRALLLARFPVYNSWSATLAPARCQPTRRSSYSTSCRQPRKQTVSEPCKCASRLLCLINRRFLRWARKATTTQSARPGSDFTSWNGARKDLGLNAWCSRSIASGKLFLSKFSPNS